jgi:Flavin containing amine oxidoreductase
VVPFNYLSLGKGNDSRLRSVGGRADPGPACRFRDRCRLGPLHPVARDLAPASRGGTEGSNPLPSSGESRANQIPSIRMAKTCPADSSSPERLLLSLSPHEGTRWSTRTGALSPDPHASRFYQALKTVKADLPIAEFLETHFAGRKYDELRRTITRMVEGYDAADPRRASTFAIRDEWMARGGGQQGRVAEGYGALVEYLVSECRRLGAAIHLGAAVTAINEDRGRIAARCRDGAIFEADAAILTVSLPLLSEIALPSAARERVAATADIGFGNVVKILLRFTTKWWADHDGRDLADLSFLLSDAAVPTWWTQHKTPRNRSRMSVAASAARNTRSCSTL